MLVIAQALLLSGAALGDEGAKAKAPPQALARTDALWDKRDDPAAVAEMKRLLDKWLAQAPSDYAILWRGAAFNFWFSDDPDRPLDQRIRFGKAGWDLGERAIAVNPDGVEGYFFSAVAMGNYSLGIGILRALAQRIEGKFTGRLREAEKRDPKFANGSIPVSWGRYHAQLPWPKYDAKKAISEFRRALTLNPHNLRARLYLAEVLLEEGDPEQAKALLDEIEAAQVGKYDVAEERRAKRWAQEVKPKIQEALNKKR